MPLWTPADLTVDPVIWLDAQDSATITETGGADSSWANKGSGPSSFPQGTGANQPVYGATSWTGSRPTLIFDRTAPKFLAASWSYTGAPLAVFMALDVDSYNIYDRYLSMSNGSGNADWGGGGVYMFTRTANTGFSMGGRAEPGGIASDLNAHIIYGVHNASGTALRLDGGTASTEGTGGGTAHNIAHVRVGRSTENNSEALTGKISEIIVLTYEPTQTEREDVEGYLAHRWGTEALLPSGHPRKSAAPTVGLSLRPDADTIVGNWLNEAGGGVLYTSLDETVAVDTDFIRSPGTPSAEAARVALTNPTTGFVLGDPVIVRYRYGTDSAEPCNLTVRLLQGSTEIASWVHTAVPLGFQTAEQTLTAPQLASINDFNDLFVEFIASV
jgi:hypothetical protein